MRAPQDPRPKTPEGFFTKGEMRKVVIMAITALVIVAAVVTSILREKNLVDPSLAELPVEGTPAMEQSVAVPEIDTSALERLVSDAREEDRATLEREAVEQGLKLTRPLTRAHYEALDTEELDAVLVKKVLASPGTYRGKAMHARGWVASHFPRTYDGQIEHHLRLTLEDDSSVYAVLSHAPESGFEVGADFVRVDGLFLKAFADETDNGWVTGPLLVGRSAERSFPAFGSMEGLEQLEEISLASVEDFSLEAGATGLPFDPLWRLMAFARDLPENAVDWASARELTPETFGALLTDGAPHRGVPFRFPISKLMGVTTKRVGENPARLDRVTEGWIGNYSWPHLVHFRAPFVREDYDYGIYVEARGFFFKNFAYDSKSKDVQVAPVFVLHSLDRFVPPVDNSMPQLMAGVAVFTISSIALLFFLVSRDRKRSQQLQETLTQRRRARRTQAEGNA